MLKRFFCIILFLTVSCASPPATLEPPAILETDVKAKIGVIVVDIQGDFTQLKNGSLAVAGTDQAYIDQVVQATRALHSKGYLIYATQDWHPQDHVSFYSNHTDKKPYDVIQVNGRDQVLWPPHCLQNSANAQVLIEPSLLKAIVRKGADKNFDSYSGFQDDGGKKTALHKILQQDGINTLYVYGIATDYCVKATAMDAAAAGYTVSVIESLSRGVSAESTARALSELKANGITILKTLE